MTSNARCKSTRPILQRKNAKLGDGVWSFSLPIAESCKSRTSLCAKACYAKGGNFNWASVKKSHRESWRAARRGDFVERVVAFCIKKSVAVLRVHVAGDFYSPGYADKWTEIATRLPGVRFLAYTRRWRDHKMVGSLGAFARLPNVSLWFSADAETGEPPRPSWFSGVAYMSLSDTDLPGYPVDLVFRDDSAAVMKRTPSGAKVCPTDDGVARKVKVTCSICKYCFSPRTPVSGLRTPLPVI